VAAWSKTSVYGCSLAGTAGSNPARGMDVLSLVSSVCCQVEVLATDRALVQRSLVECAVSECDRGTSQRRRRGTRELEPGGGGGEVEIKPPSPFIRRSN
jgi:hypothetical protein